MSDHDRNLCQICLRKEYMSFSHGCIHESMAQNEAWMQKFRINDWPRWDYSMENSTLIFSEEGKAKVICKIEVVGSTTPQSWEWSWGNENLPVVCRTRMGAVYELGEQRQWERLTTLFLESDQYVGWECASVASHVLNGIAVYRCPNSGGSEEDAVYVVVLSAEFVN